MNKALASFVVAGCVSMSTGAQAIAITVDGNLSDWGINTSSWVPNNANIHYKIEDQHDGYLNPGYGGQAYDAEALYVLLQGHMLYIALATGHNPNTAQNPGSNSYGAGDFAIDFGKDGSYELGINIKPGWDNFGEQGGVYRNVSWNYGLWNSSGAYDPSHPDTANPTSIKTGDKIGLAALTYTTIGAGGYGAWTSDMHYFYELGLDTQLLKDAGWNGTDAFNVHWSQNCANDAIIADPPETVPVPEPGTLALLPIGLVGLATLRRRKSA